jgi:hypothetical protein
MTRRFLLRGAVFCLGSSVVLFGAFVLREDGRAGSRGTGFPTPWGYGSSMLGSPARMRFADDRLSEKLHRLDATVTLDGPEAYHQPFMRLPDCPGMYTLEAGSFRDKAHRGPLNYHGPREARWIQLIAYFDPRAPAGEETVGGIHAHARWKPAGPGWAADVQYTTYDGRKPAWAPDAREHFELSFLRYTEAGPDPASRITLRRGGGMSYDTLFVVDDPAGRTEYRLTVLTYDPEQKPAGRPDDDVLRILACPEALRDYGLKCCDYLAGQIEEDFATGVAVREAVVGRPPAPPRAAGNPAPHSNGVPADRKLTDDEMKRLLDDARKHVRAQAAALARDYREMYAAVRKACPVADCVRSGPP